MKASNKDIWSPSASVMKNHDININSLTFSKLMQYLLTQKEGCLKDFNHYIQTTKEKYCQFLDEFHATFKTRQIYAGGLVGSAHADMEYDYDDGDDELIDAPLEMASAPLMDDSEKFYNEIHLFDDSAVQLRFMNNSLTISGYFTNSDLFKQITQVADKYEVIPEPVKVPGYVYAVVKDVMGNLQLHNIGLAGITLQEANYPESVVKQYNLALEDFRNSSPAGRVVILEGVPGCHRAGQQIIMSDGSLKKVEDIVVGDQLLGTDSTPRNVKRLYRGKDDMVKIVPKKGESFVVNINHVLTLVKSGTDKLIDVSVKDFMSYKNKDRYKLIRSKGVEFNYKNLKIDPYILGALLGDGSFTQSTPVIHIHDSKSPVLDYFKKYAKSLNMTLGKRQSDGKCPSYSIKHVDKTKNKNALKSKLDDLKLNMSCELKFIPQEYKTSSTNQRLELIAGLLDTDGSLDNNCFDFISKSQSLADDLVFMCRSVGLAAYIKPCFKKAQTGDSSLYFRVSISGDTDIIPTKINRKRAIDRKQIKSVLRTGFSIESLKDKENYFGFNLDGDNRYMLSDFTITHNSGKTHLVRSFLTDADDATFVLIPPDMITELSGPTFLPLLISSCSNTDNPVVLVLEDADRCLVARDDKNMNAIQALLNLSDGILGSMLDIRILATTNATKLDLEPAILRPGRLSQRIEINQLSAKETKKCWESLLPNVSLPSSMKGKHTLAEIYLEARNHGWKATE